MGNELEKFAPHFVPDRYTEEDQWHLRPFFTNLEKSVYVPLIFSPELIGALCSRTSRAMHDLRKIYLAEFVYPFVKPMRDEKDTDENWQEKLAHGKRLHEFIEFLHGNPITDIFANPRARSFYLTWLAQYGDDSIAQMSGAHIVFSALSQVTIKHFEDQRIGLAPIEKSTRYVNYGEKIGGKYLYYTDPTLTELGLQIEYEEAMDGLFGTYALLVPRLIRWLTEKFPQEKPSVIEKKAFDTLRGLLPTATLSQVAFFGNGQAFEHMISRSAKHQLGETRWASKRALEELGLLIPAFLRRLEKETSQEYQIYLAQKQKRVARFVKTHLGEDCGTSSESVRLLEYDPRGEEKVITGILFDAPGNHQSWDAAFEKVCQMTKDEKEKILASYLEGRNSRWQKVGRAFENAYVRFEILLNIGAWRDLHRHRMLTQQRQFFTCKHGYDVPADVTSAGLEMEFRNAIGRVETVFAKIESHDPKLAQYAVTLAHRLRFQQWENLRQSFWQIELRSIPEGHPDYRLVAQEKFRNLERVYPLIAAHILVNLENYDFARRGQEEKIQKKTKQNLES